MERQAAQGARVHGHTFMPWPGTPFRDVPAGQVNAETRRKLDRLAFQGRLYGHWKHQTVLAGGIACRRKPGWPGPEDNRVPQIPGTRCAV